MSTSRPVPLSRPLLAGALALALAACASLDTTRGGAVPAELPLTALPDDPDTYVWRAQDAALASRYYLAPVTWELPQSQQRLIDDEDRATLAAALTDALAQALPNLERVPQAGAGVVTVRASITGIDRSRPAANIALSLLLGPADTGGAAVNVLLEDGASGRPLAALATSRNGRMLSTKGFRRWGHAQQAFAHAGERVAPLFAAAEPGDER